MYESTAVWASRVSIDPLDLPDPVATLCPSYGEAHTQPVMALSRPVGTFELDLTTFKVGMPILCKYVDNKGLSYGWFPGIISRIVDARVDLEYDNGTYGYDVPFELLRFINNKASKRTFRVSHLSACVAFVLSTPHALTAALEAFQLVKTIQAEFELNDSSDDDTLSTPSHSRPATPPAILSPVHIRE